MTVILVFDCVKALLQIGKNVVNVFSADGKADGVGLDALIQQFFFAELAVGSGSRVDHKALDIRYICQQGEDLQTVDEFVGLRLTAFDLKGKDGTASVGEIALIQSVVGIVGQGRMVDCLHLRMVLQKFHHLFCVLRMALEAQGQGLDALEQQKRSKGGNGSAGIPEQDRPDIGYKGGRAGSLGKGNTVIAGVGSGDSGVIAGSSPVKLTGIYDDAAQGGAVTAQEFGGGMDDDVCAMLDGADKIGSTEGVVYHQRKTVLVSQLCKGINIGNVAVGVAQSFDVDGTGVVLNGGRYLTEVVDIYKGGGDAEVGQGMGQQIVAAAINGLLGDDMTAVLGQRFQRVEMAAAPEASAKAATPPSSAAMRFSSTSWVELVSLP